MILRFCVAMDAETVGVNLFSKYFRDFGDKFFRFIWLANKTISPKLKRLLFHFQRRQCRDKHYRNQSCIH